MLNSLTKCTYEPYKTPLKPTTKFGYYGAIGITSDGELMECHECGGLFKSLGIHAARKHGLKERQYRNKYKLSHQTVLVSPKQRDRYIATALRISDMEKKRRLKSLADGRKLKPNRTYIKKSLEQRNIEGTCPDQLLQKIKDLSVELDHAPSHREFSQHYQGLISIVRKTFGSWNNAKRLAGVGDKKSGRTPFYTRDSLIYLLRQFESEYGRTASWSDIRAGLIPSQWIFTKHFGSFVKARNEATKKPT